MLNMRSTEEKKMETAKKKKGEKEEEKEIWSGTDGIYDATRYTKKKKTMKTKLNVFFLHVLKALQINTSFAFDARANSFTIRE